MEYQTLSFNELSSEMLSQLKIGGFLTTKKGDEINTMTIAWGGINFVWNKPIFVVYVRYTRDTYRMLDENDEFTVSIPLGNTLKKELAYCGTKSGRDTNKIEDCNFTMIDGRTVQTPIIGECNLHYECKVLYRQAMEPNTIQKEIRDRHYRNFNYHMIYYGEIVDVYQTKGV